MAAVRVAGIPVRHQLTVVLVAGQRSNRAAVAAHIKVMLVVMVIFMVLAAVVVSDIPVRMGHPEQTPAAMAA